jgi:hypothetical protein
LSAGLESGTEQISAMNDFAPVRQKVSRKKKPKAKAKVKEDAGSPKGKDSGSGIVKDDDMPAKLLTAINIIGFSYTLLRYPLIVSWLYENGPRCAIC